MSSSAGGSTAVLVNNVHIIRTLNVVQREMWAYHENVKVLLEPPPEVAAEATVSGQPGEGS